MQLLAMVGLLIGAACWAQESTPNPPQPLPLVQAPGSTATAKGTITLPAGTRVPVTLSSQITTKSRPGDAVRAVTSFPVTVDTQVAIPAGTYVEGVIDKVDKRTPSVQMHFTRILYGNGYTVPVDANNMVAKKIDRDEVFPEAVAFANEDAPHYALAALQFPEPPLPQLPPPPPMPGPRIGPFIGLAVGGAVAVVVAGILFARHRGGSFGVLFDTGWQFEMVLQSPLSLDASSVTAVVATSNGR